MYELFCNMYDVFAVFHFTGITLHSSIFQNKFTDDVGCQHRLCIVSLKCTKSHIATTKPKQTRKTFLHKYEKMTT